MSFLKEVEHLQIPLPYVLSATNNFDGKNFIASGGFGRVYQGQSDQYGAIAVKRLDRGISGQGQHEFMMEIALLSSYKHENLVSLVGFCDQDGEKILVYKHERNGSLDKLLQSKDLNWIQRLRICLGAARGLKFLHDDIGPQHRVLHRDIKSSNILLDENWKAKISDFGLSKIGPANVPFTFLISNACGTIGYLDPGYLTTGVLTQKSDVYSFGVVLFEVLCGRPARVAEYEDERHLLFVLVKNHYKKGTLDEIVDSNLKQQMNSASLNTFLTIAYQCLKKHREDRPTMSQVVAKLQEALRYQLVASNQSSHHPVLSQELLTSTDNANRSRCIHGRSQDLESGGESQVEVVKRVQWVQPPDRGPEPIWDWVHAPGQEILGPIIHRRKRDENGGKKKVVDEFLEELKMYKSRKRTYQVSKLRSREDEYSEEEYEYMKMLMMEDLKGDIWVDTETTNNLLEISLDLERLIFKELLSQTIRELRSTVLERRI